MTNAEAIEKIKEILNTRHANGINNNALCTVKYIREVVEELDNHNGKGEVTHE